MEEQKIRECCICMSEIRDTLVEHLNCLNAFCNNCFEEVNGVDKKCPMCTVDLEDSQLKIVQLDGEKLVQCEYCEENVKAKNYDAHLEDCEKYKKKVEEDIGKNKFKIVKPTINRSTFKCPLCEVKNIDRKDLIRHVSSKHRKRPGVCPICAVQEYGDPTYVSKDLAGHLKLRHKYDLDTYTNYELDDDSILAQILAKSQTDF